MCSLLPLLGGIGRRQIHFLPVEVGCHWIYLLPIPPSSSVYWEGLEEGKTNDIPVEVGCHWIYLLLIPPSRGVYWEGLEEGKTISPQ